MTIRVRKQLWATLALAFVLLNFVAYRHAYRMTHFVSEGERTRSPEKLSALERVDALVTGVEIPKPVNTSTPDASYRTATIKTTDGHRLEAWDIPAGDGADVAVMFDGYAVSKQCGLREATVFHELGQRVLLVDFRGAGGSDGNVTTLGWREAKDVAAAMSWAHNQWPQSKLILCGKSMGAVAALRAIATEGVEPSALLMEAPFDRLLTTVGHRYNAMGLPSFPFAQLLVFWGGVQLGFSGFAHNPVEYARTAHCRTLVISGAEDPWAREQEVRAVAQAVRGPVTVEIFPGVGHGSCCDAAPEKYGQIVRVWLESVAQSRSLLAETSGVRAVRPR